jgi:hypothetical protein
LLSMYEETCSEQIARGCYVVMGGLSNLDSKKH